MENFNIVGSQKSTQGLALVTDVNGLINKPSLSGVEITFLKNVRRPNDFYIVALQEALEGIRSGQYQNEIDILRRKYKENLEQYKEAKSRLPSGCFSGLFQGSATNHNFTYHSGIFIVDIDDLAPDEIGSIKEKISKIPYIIFVFISPSGFGLKVGVHISKVSDGQAYKECFNSVKGLFEGICVLDESGKDVSRKCFISHDPDMYVNYSAAAFDPVIASVDNKLSSIEVARPTDERESEDAARCVRQCENIILNAEPGEYHHCRLKAGRLAGGFIAAGRITKDEAISTLLKVSDAVHGGQTSDKERKAIEDGILSGELEPLYRDKVCEFLERFVFVGDLGLVADLHSPPSTPPVPVHTFNQRYAPDVQKIQGADGSEKTVKVPHQWLSSQHRKTVEAQRYAPGKPRIFSEGQQDFINTFHFPDHLSPNEDMDFINQVVEHIGYVFGDKEAGIFIDYLAHLIQFPQVRPKFTPLSLAAEHGVGRGFIVEVIQGLIGRYNCASATMAVLANESGNKKDNYLDRTLFCAIHEVKQSDKRYEINDKIRDKLTESTLQVDIKYGANDYASVYTRILMMSNHVTNALVIPEEDRRIWVMACEERPKDDGYYKTLYESIHSEQQGPQNLANLFHYLKMRDISAFNPGMRAPMTPAKRRLINAGCSPAEIALDDLLEQMPDDVDILEPKQLARALLKITDYFGSGLGLMIPTSNPELDNPLKAMLKDKSRRAGLHLNQSGKFRWKADRVKPVVLRNFQQWETATQEQILSQLNAAEAWISSLPNPKITS